MRESDTYLAILEEGEEKGEEKTRREDILIAGEEKFGPPDESVNAHLEGIKDRARLARIFRRSFKASSWQELLDTQ